MDLPLIGSYDLEAKPHSVQRTVNLIPVPQEPGNERTGWVLKDVKGLDLFNEIESDENFSAVTLLLHGDGTNGSTSIVDSSINNRTPSVNTGVTISTGAGRFGGSSIFAPATQNELRYASISEFSDSPPFTIEFWLNVSDTTTTRYFSGKSASEYFILQAGGQLSYVNNDTVEFGVLTAGQWYFVALSCTSSASNQMHAYLDGVSTGSSTNSVTSASNQPLSITSVPGRADLPSLYGYIDEYRYTAGVSRYPNGTSFSPPTSPFPNF